MTVGRLMAAMAAAILLSAACTDTSREELVPPRDTTTTAPPTTAALPVAPTTSAPPVSQPAQRCTEGTEHAWYEGFVSAYNTRNVGRLEQLLPFAETFTDPLAAVSGQATFRDIDSWTSAVWATGDTLKMIGYEGGGRTEIIVHRRPLEPDVGLLESRFLFFGDGCTVTGVGASALVGQRSPCAFYAAVPDAGQAGAPTLSGCDDGSGNRARISHEAMWLGDTLVVLGGSPGSVEFTSNDGFSLEAGGTWRAVPPSPYQTALGDARWTGRDFLLWGGRPILLTSYDHTTRQWSLLEQPAVQPMVVGGSVWTGEDLIVWGSDLNYVESNALAYNRAAGTWRDIAVGPLSHRSLHTIVWTGAEVLVWGGTNGRDYGDGAAYDPATDSWRELASAGIAPRNGHSAVWTGSEMIVYGGTGPLEGPAGGAAYDPARDAWRELPEAPIPGRHWHTATWTGTEMMVFGGYDSVRPLGDAAAYDPATDTWRVIESNVEPRCLHSATWTGTDLIVFGGYGGCGNPGIPALHTGVRYDPATDTWTALPGGPTEE